MSVSGAIFFSLSILWRYLLTFPFLLIGLFLFGFAGGLVGALIGFIIPGASVLATTLVSTTSSMIPILVGARLGFQARHIRPSIGLRKLIVPALAYGVAEMVAIFLLLAPAFWLALLYFAPALADLADDASLSVDASLSAVGPGLMLAVGGLVALCVAVASGVRACLLVPVASAAIGRDPDDRPYTPFRNFGAAFWPLFVTVALSYVAALFLYIATFAAFFFLIPSGALEAELREIDEMVQGTRTFQPPWTVIALVICYIAISLWTLSLQCAGAVLAYLGLRTSPQPLQPDTDPGPAAPQPPVQSGARMSAEELRALRKSRQKGG